MSVRTVCERHVDVARPDESVRLVACRMRDRNVGSLVVVDEDRCPVGIVTDRDLVIRVLAKSADPDAIVVGDVMTQTPECVPVDASMETALAIMRNCGVRRVPVIDAAGTLLGVFSLDDALAVIAEDMNAVRQLIEKEGPRAVAGD